MTALGASIVVPDAVRAVTEILPEVVEITDAYNGPHQWAGYLLVADPVTDYSVGGTAASAQPFSGISAVFVPLTGEGEGGAPHLHERPPRVDPHEDVDAPRARGLRPADQAQVAEGRAHDRGDGDELGPLDAGHRVSARQAYLRAAVYYAAAYVFVDGTEHPDAQLTGLFAAHR